MKTKYTKCLLIWNSEVNGDIIACKDGKFRRSVFFGTPSSSCKFWKKEGFARRFAKKHNLEAWTIKFIYDGDSVDCFANVTKGEN